MFFNEKKGLEYVWVYSTNFIKTLIKIQSHDFYEDKNISKTIIQINFSFMTIKMQYNINV